MEITDVNAPAGEPSAPAAPVQYDSWDDKGTPIVSARSSEATPSKPDSAPVAQGKEEKPETKPDIAAESGAAKDRQELKPSKKESKLSADERIAQLEATIEKIRQGKGEQQPTKPAEPSSAKAPVQPQKLEAPKKPDIKDFKGDDAWERYDATKDEYVDKLTDYKTAVALQNFQQEQARAEADRKFSEELAKTKERHPDFDEVAKPAAVKLWNDQAVPQVVKDRLSRSPLLMDVMYVLGGDEKQFSDFLETAKSDPGAAIEKLGVIQHLIREALDKPSAEAGKEQARGEDGKFQANSEKEAPVPPKPRAPKPPSEVGGRGTPGEDALVEAARAGRFPDFEAEQWRRVKASRQQA